MSRAMDRIRREAREQYGAAPATPEQALAHVLTVLDGEPDDRLMVEATNGIYGDGVRTGLTMGDLRALAGRLIPAPAAIPRFVVDEYGPRDFAVRDTVSQLSYDACFTRKAAQDAADRRNAKHPPASR